MKSITLRVKNNIVYFLPSSKNAEGRSFFNGIGSLSDINKHDNLLETFKLSLITCDQIISSDYDVKKSLSQVVKNWGYSSLTKFNENAKNIRISVDEQCTEFIPSDNLGSRKGFLTTKKHDVITIDKNISNFSAIEFYNAISEAITRSN